MLLAAGGEYGQFQERLISSVHKINDLANRVRSKAAFLRPPSLDDLGLVEVIKNITDALNRLSSINAEVTISGPKTAFPRSVETALYRCVQESLTNVVRHAAATSVQVNLAWTSQKITCSIKDDGMGFDVPAAVTNPETLGLKGMQERVSCCREQLKSSLIREREQRLSLHCPLT